MLLTKPYCSITRHRMLHQQAVSTNDGKHCANSPFGTECLAQFWVLVHTQERQIVRFIDISERYLIMNPKLKLDQYLEP